MGKWKQTAAIAAVLSMSTAAYGQSVDEERSAEVGQVVDEIVVIGTDQGRYRIDDSGALTGFPLDFLELPRVVNVIPEQLVLDQKITDLAEALRNTPGITQSDGFGGTNDDFFVRGFRRNTVYRNGFRRATNFKTNLTNVEYTQVVRGPASITYGQVEPGGLVDIVTKKPLNEQRISGEARWGSFEDQLYLLDWSQPVTDSFGVRVVASTQDANSFRAFTDIKRDAISLSARYDVSPSTRLDFAYEYREESRPLDRGTVTVRTPDGAEIINNLIDIPISRRFGEPFEIAETDFHFAEAIIEQDFGEDWKLRVSGALEDSFSNDLQARPLLVLVYDADAPISPDGFITGNTSIFQGLNGVFDDPTDQVFLVRRTDGNRDSDTRVYYANAVLTGEFTTGPFQHRVAIAGDFRDSDGADTRVDGPSTDGTTARGPLFNIRNPIYGNLPDSLPTDGLPRRINQQQNFGASINDYIDLTDRLSVLVGLRYDTIDLFLSDTDTEVQDAFSPQAAVNYKIAETASAFFSYSRSFTPNIGFNFQTNEIVQFDPEKGEQYEFGAKAEFFDDQLQVVGALYRIDKTNVLGFDDMGAPELIDGQTSQGVEVSVTGQPIAGMNVVLGYAYTDAEIGDSGGANDGNRPTNVAENSFTLWTSYELQSGLLEGLGFGGGVFHTGDRFGDNANTFTLGAYTTVDLSAWYTVAAPGLGPDRTIRFQVAAKNLLDEEFFPASGGNARITVGAPRAFVGSVSFDF